MLADKIHRHQVSVDKIPHGKAGWSTIGKPDGALNNFVWTRHILINPDLFPAMLKPLSFATNEFGTLLPKTSVSISVEPRIHFVLPHIHITSMLLIGGDNEPSSFNYPNKVLEFWSFGSSNLL